MRKVNVTINDDKTVDVTEEAVGYVEESNATQLEILLNTELQANEIEYHVVSFRHGENDEKMVSQRIYPLEDEDEETDAYRIDDKIIINLPQYVTRYPNIYVQLEGHILKQDILTSMKHLDAIIKSPVFYIRLDESITGDEGELNVKTEGIFSELVDMTSKFEAILPMTELLNDGLHWYDLKEYMKPPINQGDGEESIVIGSTDTNIVTGDYSAAIGRNLKVTGNSSILVGEYGKAIQGILFAVANGTADNEKLAMEVGKIDATFYVPIYGVTPSLTAPTHAIPTIKWFKDYLDAVVYPKYDGDIASLKEDLPDGLDQVSKEVLELRDILRGEINNTKPTVSPELVLLQNSWTENADGKFTQTVVVGMNTSKRNEIDVEAESLEEWGKCFVIAISENDNGVVFEANTVPSKNLSFRITSTEVNYAV